MRITSLDNSNTMRRYQVTFESPDEALMTNDELFDYIESYNYGGSVITRNNEQALFYVYID